MLELGQKVRIVDDGPMDKDMWGKGKIGRFIPFECLPRTAQADAKMAMDFAFDIIDGAITTEEAFSPVHSKQLEKIADLVDASANADELKFGKVFTIKDPAGVAHAGMIQSLDEEGNIRAVVENVGFVLITMEEFNEFVVK